jgi:hypothetical protein
MIVNFHFLSINKKGLFNLFLIFLTIFLFTAVQAQDSEPPEKIRELGLSTLKGEVTVYYSEGYSKRAAYLQDLAEAASRFFEKPEILGVKVDLHLAVLDPADWAKFTKLPYGIAHILPKPPTAILAASADNVIARRILMEKDQVSKVTLKALDELDISFNEAAATFVDLIGFHEMGHIYAHHHGSHPWPEQKWLGEFVATYLAYAYMKENQPKLAKLWKTMNDHSDVRTAAKHTTLADFERLYLGVGGDNYGWYQARFQQKVEEIYAKAGISFMQALKKSLAENPGTSKDDPFRLKELDTISKGFTTWAKGPDGNLK